LKENTQKGSKEVFNVEANGWYRAAMENIVEINEEFRAVSASQKVDVLYEKATTVARNCRRGVTGCGMTPRHAQDLINQRKRDVIHVAAELIINYLPNFQKNCENYW
jgi:hypothetical protein